MYSALGLLSGPCNLPGAHNRNVEFRDDICDFLLSRGGEEILRRRLRQAGPDLRRCLAILPERSLMSTRTEVPVSF